jgi:hypothetical protein
MVQGESVRAADWDGGDGIEILPVVVFVRVFPARPSSVPDIRDFVRQHLAQTSLSNDYIRTLGTRVSDVLLESAGMGGAIQVSLRIFGDQAEIDVLHADRVEEVDEPPDPVPIAIEAAPVPVPTPAPRQPGVTFAVWFAGALRREGMTMEAAARELKVSVKTVSRWVAGSTEPRLRDLSRIRDVFGDLPFP